METTGLSTASHSEGPIWLSGELLTLLNKIVLPTIWVAALVGVGLSAIVSLRQTGSMTEVHMMVLLALMAAALLPLMAFRIQRVGYAGAELIVASFSREARIPFEDIEAVETVWWYRPRAVRIRFRKATPFGQVVYYVPKLSIGGNTLATPEQALRDLLMHAGVLT